MLEKFGGWSSILAELCAGNDLTAEKTEALLSEILSGESEESQIAAFLIAIKVKGETTEEITGLVNAMLKASQPLSIPVNAIDIVGTGGSIQRRQAALNVSTMASFVAAAAGAVVCKHGNRKASSTSGSFDFLEALGLPVEQTPDEVSEQLYEKNLAFAFAKTFHPAMRFAGPVRAAIGIPTVFNILGPLSHPGRVSRHLIGTVDEILAKQMAEVLLTQGAKRAWVVVGDGGVDEIAVTGPTFVMEVKDGSIHEWVLDPLSLGFSLHSPESIRGGSPTENAEIAKRIFTGEEQGARREMIILNAAAGLTVAEVAENLSDGIEKATISVENGSVMELLDSLKVSE
jgi:anthranilate phosphoribosyltransferase